MNWVKKCHRAVWACVQGMLCAAGPGFHFLPNCTCGSNLAGKLASKGCHGEEGCPCAVGESDEKAADSVPVREVRGLYPCAIRKHLVVAGASAVPVSAVFEVLLNDAETAETGPSSGFGKQAVGTSIRGPPVF